MAAPIDSLLNGGVDEIFIWGSPVWREKRKTVELAWGQCWGILVEFSGRFSWKFTDQAVDTVQNLSKNDSLETLATMLGMNKEVSCCALGEN